MLEKFEQIATCSSFVDYYDTYGSKWEGRGLIASLDPTQSFRRIGGLKIRAAALAQLRAVCLHPSVDRRVVNFDTALHHHFLQVPVTQAIAQIGLWLT